MRESSTVPLSQKLALGCGFFCLLFLEKACEILAVPFYQMTLGVDPFLFSIALTIPIIFSTLLSPWVGQLSDNFSSKYGRRRPFVFVSAWLSAILFGVMWMVPEGWSTNSQLLYFFIVSIFFYAAISFYSVPLMSLSYEITKDENERIKVMEINSYFIKLASTTVQWLFPLAALSFFSSIFLGIKTVGWLVAILVIGCIGILPAIFVKEVRLKNHKTIQNTLSLFDNIKSILRVPLMQLVICIVLIQVGIAAYAAKMDYYVLVYYMFGGNIENGATWKAILSMGYAIIAAIYIPIVSWLSRRYGKFTALKVIFMLSAIGGGAKWFIYTPGVTWLLLLDPILCSAIWTAMTVIIPVIVAQASDIDREKGEGCREGRFAAIYHLTITFSIMIAILGSGLTLDLIGFDAHNATHQTPESLLSMRRILTFGTMLSGVLGIYVLYLFKKRIYTRSPSN